VANQFRRTLSTFAIGFLLFPAGLIFISRIPFAQRAFGQGVQPQTSVAQSRGAASNTPSANSPDILAYIKEAWNTLGRSVTECRSIQDPKFGAASRAILYIPAEAAKPFKVQQLEKNCNVEVKHLPEKITHLGSLMPDRLIGHALLYLPYPYVVPGGRFNEMYGWDSYFIIRGLLEDGRADVSRGMIENFFYEIDNYGAILNANRAYYLSRSQPPFLTSMILAQYAADEAAGRADLRWLANAYEHAERDVALWMRTPKLAGSTGLARYLDLGEGPVADVADHPEYYEDVATWLIKHPDVKTSYLAPPGRGFGPELKIVGCTRAPCSAGQNVQLTADYYKGDRSMRESGFDISFRFGPFGGSTHHFAPVCLNSLLYKEDMDLAEMATKLGKKLEAEKWKALAARRRQISTRYLWDEKKKMFFDYDYTTSRRSTYNYASTFYPLWSGLATPQQARDVMSNLKVFEQPGGLAMSDVDSGVQWDKPYGWAPVNMVAIEGMRRYGFTREADRLSKEFLSTVLDNFRRDGTIREKYNVVTRSTEANVTAGYQTNIVGFGWTNGAFLVLLHAMDAEDQRSVLGN
jgi:alpha,alpha-trehalase